MFTHIFIRRPLSCFLAACLFLSLISPAAASDTTLPAETIGPEASVPEETEPTCTFQTPYNLYFGLLHAHTDSSDGLGSVEEAFSHAASPAR